MTNDAEYWNEVRDLERVSVIEFVDAPSEPPKVDANASLILPTELYASWMRSIQRWLEQAGAKNGVDFRSAVASAGMDEKKRHLFRISWRAITPKGVAYLNLMAQTLSRLSLPEEAPQLPSPDHAE